MRLLDALKELSEFVDINAEMMTDNGGVFTLVELWAEESMAEDNGYEDPNEYVVLADGIHYLTNDGKDGGVAYAIN